MTKTLVTGASGFLGTHLLELAGGEDVRALSREPGNSSDVEIVEGSILDEQVVRKAVRGVDSIYHLAGRVSRDAADTRELYQVHVEGTTILCRAAREEGVSRIVMASTSGTIAVTEDGESIPDETASPPLELIGGWPYYTSKLYQEQVALKECAGGPDLVILNPSLLLGPGDKRLSSTEDILKFLSGEIPVVPPGGISFVDVRDVAEACREAMRHGRPGERYLLGGPNWTFQVFFERLGRMSKVKAPRLKLPEAVYGLAGKTMDALYRHWDKVPPVDRISVEMGQRFWYVDSAKARRELSFEPRDPYETLNDTIAYINEHFLGESVFG